MRRFKHDKLSNALSTLIWLSTLVLWMYHMIVGNIWIPLFFLWVIASWMMISTISEDA